MQTYQIKQGKNPEYKVLRTESLKGNMLRAAKETGKETKIYYMQGITRTGKISKEVLMCFKFVSGKFIPVFSS